MPASNGDASMVAHGAPLRQARHVLRHVGPASARVPAHVHQPVVAAGPEQRLVLRRFGEGEDRPVDLDAGVVAGDGTAGPLLLRLVVAGEIGAGGGPALPAVGAAEEHVARVIDQLRACAARRQDRRRPLEAVLQVLAAVSRGILGIDRHVPLLPRAVVVARDVAAVLAGVDDVGIGRVVRGVPGLAAAHAEPVGKPDAVPAQAVARPAGGAQVLHRARDAVRYLLVNAHVVELRDRERRRVPGVAAVQR